MGVDKEYAKLLKEINREGVRKNNRTGVVTKSLFGKSISFDVSKYDIPVIHSRRINVSACKAEAEWFYKGVSLLEPLEKAGCNFYKNQFLSDEHGRRTVGNYVGYMLRQGPLGDQIAQVESKLRFPERSRRMVLSLHNDEAYTIMPSCITSVILSEGSVGIEALITYRSCDILVGLPNDILSMYFLVSKICEGSGLELTRMHISMADAHYYLSQASDMQFILEYYASTRLHGKTKLDHSLYKLEEYNKETVLHNMQIVL